MLNSAQTQLTLSTIQAPYKLRQMIRKAFYLIKKIRINSFAKSIKWSLGYQALLVTLIFGFIFLDRGFRGFDGYHLTRIFTIWDAAHYIYLSEHGYVTSGVPALFIVFFPLYPILIHALNIIIHNSIVSSILISNICSIAGHALLPMVFKEWGLSDRVATSSFFLFCVSPISIFFSQTYTEGLYLFLAAAFFLKLAQRNYISASIIAGLTSGCRIMGIIMLPTLIFDHFKNLSSPTDFRAIALKVFRKWFLYSLISSTGLLVYLAINYHLFKNPFYFRVPMLGNWNKTFRPFWLTYWENFKWIANQHNWHICSLFFDQLLTLIFPIIIILYISLHKSRSKPGISSPVLFWCFLQWWVICSQSYWLSSIRYLLLIFPIYPIIVLLLGNFKKTYYILFGISTVSFIYAVWVFCHEGWVA